MPKYLSNIDLTKRELQNAKIHNVGALSSPTASGDYGLLQYRTSDNTMHFWNGTTWTQFATGTTPDATTGSKGIIQLAQDLGGTAAAPTVVQGSALINGAVGTPSLRFANSATTGIYRPAADQIGFSSAGTLKLTIGTTIDVNGVRVTGVSDPTAAQDAATKAYVDSIAQGLDAKASVRASTVGSETFTIAAGAVTQIAGTTLDGVTPAVNDRILVKDAPAATGVGSANSSQPGNGIYIVTNNTTNLTVSRATDMDAWTEVPNAYTWVEEGTTQSDTGWVVTANTGGTLNTTAITWSLFSSAGSLIAGAGLTKTANTIDLVAADTSLTVNADSAQVRLQTNGGLQVSTGVGILLNGGTLNLSASGLKVTDNTFQPLDATLTALAGYNTNGILVQTAADTFAGRTLTGTAARISVTNGNGVSGNPTVDIDASYVGQTSITTLGTIATGTWQGTAVGVAYGGTGQTTSKAARETGLAAAGYYSATATTGAGTTISVPQATHLLRSTRGLKVQVQEESTGEIVYPDIAVAATGDVTVTFGVTQGATSYRTTIIG